jgi:hypothetical protein
MGERRKDERIKAKVEADFDIYLRKLIEAAPDISYKDENIRRLVRSSYMYGVGVGMQIVLQDVFTRFHGSSEKFDGGSLSKSEMDLVSGNS